MDHQSIIHHHPSATQTLGVVIGSFTGIIKAGTVSSFMHIDAITTSIEIDTAILAAIGATAGFVVTTMWKYLHEFIVKKIKKRNEKIS